jgi:hypothetical protein
MFGDSSHSLLFFPYDVSVPVYSVGWLAASEKLHHIPFDQPHSNSSGGQHLFVSLRLFHLLLKM